MILWGASNMKTFIKNFFTLRPKRSELISNKRATIGALLVFATQLLDLLTTWYGTTFTGAVEANPLMANFVHNSFIAFVAIKLTGSALLIYYSWKRKYMPFIIAAIYALVILNNIFVITR